MTPNQKMWAIMYMDEGSSWSYETCGDLYTARRGITLYATKKEAEDHITMFYQGYTCKVKCFKI